LTRNLYNLRGNSRMNSQFVGNNEFLLQNDRLPQK
jgi:hypothetical protein